MREARFLVLRGTAEGRRYVRHLRPDPGDVAWTEDRAAAHRFISSACADLVQRQIVVRDGIAVAVMPDLD